MSAARTAATVPQARALLEAAQLQQQHLAQVKRHLPQRLPSFAAGAADTGGAGSGAAAQPAAGVKDQGQGAAGGGGGAAAVARNARKGEGTAGAAGA